MDSTPRCRWSTDPCGGEFDALAGPVESADVRRDRRLGCMGASPRLRDVSTELDARSPAALPPGPGPGHAEPLVVGLPPEEEPLAASGDKDFPEW
jgi:hypothetical protein